MTTSEHDGVVRQSFRRQVELFQRADSPFAGKPTAWLGALHGDMVVVDVACGAGHVAEQVASEVRQVVGVDLTPELLRLGAERLRVAGIDNVLLQEGNVTALPFVDASFDVVACRSALHHFGRPVDAIAEMARVCRPGGRVVVSDLVAPNAEIREQFDAVHRALDPSHASAFVDDEIAALLEDAVGPLTYADSPAPFTLPIDSIFTDVSDRTAVLAALEAELDGGPATGLAPSGGEAGISAAFRSVVAHATRT
jgi:SAM-dependent methyltransferase